MRALYLTMIFLEKEHSNFSNDFNKFLTEFRDRMSDSSHKKHHSSLEGNVAYQLLPVCFLTLHLISELEAMTPQKKRKTENESENEEGDVRDEVKSSPESEASTSKQEPEEQQQQQPSLTFTDGSGSSSREEEECKSSTSTSTSESSTSSYETNSFNEKIKACIDSILDLNQHQNST